MGFVERSARVSLSRVPQPPSRFTTVLMPGLVHLGEVVLDRGWRQSVLAAAQVVVHVHNRVERLLDDGRLRDHHRLRFPVAELEVADVPLRLNGWQLHFIE